MIMATFNKETGELRHLTPEERYEYEMRRAEERKEAMGNWGESRPITITRSIIEKLKSEPKRILIIKENKHDESRT